MCGRFTVGVSDQEMEDHLHDYYHIEEFKAPLGLPRFNVAPGQNVLSVINDGSRNRVGLLKWGLVPSFAKDEKIGNMMINAKAETLLEKPSFRDSFRNRRCIILADGFYEWIKAGSKRLPVRILLNSHGLFPMAGLWSAFTRTDGSKLYTCTIITTKANQIVAPIHDRMPVILTDETKDIWLNPTMADPDRLLSLLAPFDPLKMYAYKVSAAVNNAKVDCPECINSL